MLRTQLGLEADFPSAVVIGLAIAHLLDHGSTRAHLGVRSGCALSEGGLHVACNIGLESVAIRWSSSGSRCACRGTAALRGRGHGGGEEEQGREGAGDGSMAY